ncbi:tyrosine-type recombinase/integrase [uncultured Subdoligranulum sp.]|uniref:tyrosine-type recombinase/integrase n=1 Tax=uncultured Subdoligranulum sp. TaxID=512298 RepID=UPI00320B42AA
MEYQKIIQSYEHWLAHREYSPATIQKYTRALTRFFADTGAGKKPTRETVAAWRDSLTAKGYTPSTVNALLAAVNDYQESIDNPAGKAKPLKRQRRIFADPGRELSRAEYFRLLSAARAIGNKRSQLLLETICSTGIRVSELQFITAEAVRRRKASIRCKGKCREILLPAELCHRLTRWCQKHRIHTGPVFLSRVGKPLCRVTVWKLLKALCERANVAWKKVFPHNLRHLFARTFYDLEKNISKLADLLGHSSIETTRIYIMESGAEHERLLNKMHLLL